MRIDFVIALLLFGASVPGSYAVSYASERVGFLKNHSDIAWYGSVVLAAALVLLAMIVAVRGEKKAERKGARKRMLPLIGMLVSGTAFVACFVWYMAPAREPVADKPDSIQTADIEPLKVGTLRFVTANVEVERSQSTNESAATVKVEIINDSDKLIFFHAVTAGNVNGIAFDPNKIQFDGYAFPHKETYLYSRRVPGLTLAVDNTVSQATVKAIYEYDIQYKYVEEKRFSRRTARGINISLFGELPYKEPGTVSYKSVQVRYYNEVEE